MVTRGIRKILFYTEIDLGRQYGSVPQRKLDLLQGGVTQVSQPRE